MMIIIIIASLGVLLKGATGLNANRRYFIVRNNHSKTETISKPKVHLQLFQNVVLPAKMHF